MPQEKMASYEKEKKLEKYAEKGRGTAGKCEVTKKERVTQK